ncbi:MAG: ABC transporter transmembrane domain-containing protein, partial [Gammaproteobacteria bacterium]|nr:ABC transporter transmembrane domain-containing protein [Gammaproteobacteria bacterium]
MARFSPNFDALGGVNADSGMWALACGLIAAAPGRCALAALLLLTAGVTEAFGLLLIIPLLHVAGLADAGGETSPVVEAATQVMVSLGVPLNLSSVLVVFLGLAAVRSAAAWARGVLATELRLVFIDRFRGDLYAAVAGASWGELLGRRRSDIQHVLTDSVGRIGTAAFLLLQLAVGVTLALVQFAVALAVSPPLAAVAALVGLLLAVAGRPLLLRSHELGRQLTGSGRILRGYATDFLDGLKTAKSHNSEAAHVDRFQSQAANVRGQQVTFAVLSGGTRATLQFAAAVALAGLAWHAISGPRLALPELALLALVFARVIPTMLNLLQWAQSFINALPAYAEATVMRDELRTAAE